MLTTLSISKNKTKQNKTQKKHPLCPKIDAKPAVSLSEWYIKVEPGSFSFLLLSPIEAFIIFDPFFVFSLFSRSFPVHLAPPAHHPRCGSSHASLCFSMRHCASLLKASAAILPLVVPFFKKIFFSLSSTVCGVVCACMRSCSSMLFFFLDLLQRLPRPSVALVQYSGQIPGSSTSALGKPLVCHSAFLLPLPSLKPPHPLDPQRKYL